MQMKRQKRLVVLSILLAIFFYSIFPGVSTAAEKKVLSIQVKGNEAISSAAIISKIKTRVGAALLQEFINDDIKRLYSLGYFTDVSFDVRDDSGGVKVTIIVEEKPVIEDVVFSGNKKFTAKRLKKVIKTKSGDMLNYSKLSEDMSEIKAFYERSGFYRTAVKYQLEKGSQANHTVVKVEINEETRMRIKRVFVEGNKAVKTSKIRTLMQTRPAWLFRRGYFSEEEFENDLSRIKMHYENKGYLDVGISPKFDYEENGIMFITLQIDEGDQYFIGTVTVQGNVVLPESEIREKISVKKGDPFSYATLRSDMEKIRARYYRDGYMNAQIGVDRILKPKERALDIVFNIDARQVVMVGKIGIKGNTKTKDVVIRRELRVYPGERFDGDKIRRSKERLYNLGFFEDVFLETVATKDGDVNDLNVSVKETKTGEFSFGGGYSSIDEFIGFVQVSQKNFDLFNFPTFTGDGQYLDVRAELGTVRSNYDISWTEPWMLDYPVSFGLDAYHRTHYRRTHVGYGFQEVRAGGDVRLGKEFLEYFRSDLIYKLENVEISDIADEASDDLKAEEGENWLSSLTLGMQLDKRDNRFSPTRGFVSNLTLENTGGVIGGDKDFYKTFLSGSFYYSPIKKIVIEFKGRAGITDSYDNTDEVPLFERFFAGGANTIRGYRERKVGPRDPLSNDSIGGESTLLGNVELSFPIYEKLVKGAVFYDVGSVWRRVEDFGQSGYKQGTGIGLRLKTPIGPLRLDWGYPLSDNHDDEKEGRFYFSVSHGF